MHRGRFVRAERQPSPGVRAEDEDHRASVQSEDAGGTDPAHVFQEAGHREEVVAEAGLHGRRQKADSPAGERQRQGVLVEQADVAGGGVGRLQESTEIVAVVLVGHAPRDPAQGVHGDAELVLQIMEGRFDFRIERQIVAALEANGLRAGTAVQGVVPAVVPGDGNRPARRRQGRFTVALDGMRDGVDDEGLDDGASEHVGPVVESRPRRETESALGVQGGADDLPVGGVDRTAAIDIGDVRREQRRTFLPAQRGGCVHRAAGKRKSRGTHELPPRRLS